jgi:hypothetical protein
MAVPGRLRSRRVVEHSLERLGDLQRPLDLRQCGIREDIEERHRLLLAGRQERLDFGVGRLLETAGVFLGVLQPIDPAFLAEALIASSTYGSQSDSNAMDHMIRLPLSKITCRWVRRPSRSNMLLSPGCARLESLERAT